MEGIMLLENSDFKLEIKKIKKETRELGNLATRILSNELIDEQIKKKQTLPKRKKDGQFEKDLPKDARIETHGRMPVYREIVENILTASEDKITMKEIEGIIKEFYKEKLNKQITNGTKRTYASVYSNGLVEKKQLNRITRNTFSKYSEKMEKEKKMEIAERIYQLAQDRGWMGKNNIRIKAIAEALNENEEDIKTALVELFKRNKATQWPGDMIRF